MCLVKNGIMLWICLGANLYTYIVKNNAFENLISPDHFFLPEIAPRGAFLRSDLPLISVITPVPGTELSGTTFAPIIVYHENASYTYPRMVCVTTSSEIAFSGSETDKKRINRIYFMSFCIEVL